MEFKNLNNKEKYGVLHKDLGYPTRKDIIELLSIEDLIVSDIREITKVESTLLSHHFEVLKEVQLVKYKIKKGSREKVLEMVNMVLKLLLCRSYIIILLCHDLFKSVKDIFIKKIN